MKTTITTFALTLVATVTPAFAANNSGGSDIGWLGMIFLGFGALIIAFQLVPALMLFAGLVKSLFGATANKTAAPDEAK